MTPEPIAACVSLSTQTFFPVYLQFATFPQDCILPKTIKNAHMNF